VILSQALYVNIGGASDYWFTADATCVPGGPAFSFTYYITTASVIGSIAGMVGVSLFQMFLSRGTYRAAFCTTLGLKLLASLFDLFIVRRDNIRFGIPDKVAFLLGDAIIASIIGMLYVMFRPRLAATDAAGQMTCDPPRNMSCTSFPTRAYCL
jgi:hypothetical protein